MEMIILQLLIACLIGCAGVWIFTKFKILDRPGPDVPKRDPVPTLQGIVLFVGFLIMMGIFLPQYLTLSTDNPFFGLILGGGLIVLVSLIDELGRIVDRRFRVGPIVRLISQLAAVLIAFYVSGVGFSEFLLPGGVLIEFGRLTQIVLTLVRYLIFINAINFLDGIYGLASGMSTIGFLTVSLLIGFVVIGSFPDISDARAQLLWGVGNVAQLLMCLSLVFTIIEFKPRGLLRDVGTTFLGFSLAYLALLGGAKIGTMIVVLALPLFDALWVVGSRIYRKQSPFKGDFTHLHHRLMALKWNRNEVRFFVWSLSLFMLILMILQGTDRIGKVIIFLVMAVAFFGINRYLFRYKKLPDEYQVDGIKE